MPQSRPYPSDVSDARWALISPTLEQWRHERHARRPTEVKDPADLRSVWNAILYVNRTGIAWKYLPHDFPPPGTAYYYAAWRDEGIFRHLNADLTALARQRAGRKAEPTAAIIDTQSIKPLPTSPSKPINHFLHWVLIFFTGGPDGAPGLRTGGTTRASIAAMACTCSR